MDIASLPWKVVNSFLFSRAFDYDRTGEGKAKQISTLISKLTARLTSIIKIIKTAWSASRIQKKVTD